MEGLDITPDLDRICYVEKLAPYERAVRICSQNQGILLPIKTDEFMKLVCNKLPQLPDPEQEGKILLWRVGLSYNRNGTAKYSDGTSYNSSTDITMKEHERYNCSQDCQVIMWCSKNFVYKAPYYKRAIFLCYRMDANILPTDSPSTSRKCQSQTVEWKEKMVGGINLDRIFAIEKRTTYNESVQLCAERNAILLPIKTVDELLFVCDNFPQIPDPNDEGYSYRWRVGLNFMENGTGIWADGSTYNPVTDNVHVDKEKYSCSHDCEGATSCERNKLYTHPISKELKFPSLCYKATEQTTILPTIEPEIATSPIEPEVATSTSEPVIPTSTIEPVIPTSTSEPVIPTSNLPPLIGIRSSNVPLIGGLTAASVLLSLIFLFLLFCGRKRRQKRRQRLRNERFVFNANTESLNAEFGDREFLLHPETHQDQNAEDPHITPNPVNRQDLEKCGARDDHIHSEICDTPDGNDENQTRELPVIPQNRRQDEDPKEVRIVDGRKHKIEVDAHVGPSQQQQPLEGDDTPQQ